jgi:hypothetical protein
VQLLLKVLNESGKAAILGFAFGEINGGFAVKHSFIFWLFPDPLHVIAAFPRLAHLASSKRYRIIPLPGEVLTAGT